MEAVAVRTWHPERSVAWVVAVLILVLAVHRQTAWSMVETWRDSGTYSHGFLIVPVFLWLVWDRRLALSRLPTCPSWLGLFGLVILGSVWLIGDFASANAPAQFAVVAMVPVTVFTVLGTPWVRALAFPLMFLFFAVPFGEALVPYLTGWTADFAVAALKLSGVPVYREGNNFSIPSGDWSVIEACSGIRYVFACLTVATLYAWIIYRTTTRRLLFVLGALVIAMVANWIRAYLTVLVAHLSGNRFGTGFDHIVFAEVLYGVILLLVFWLGSFWREDRADGLVAKRSDPPAAPHLLTASARRGRSLSASLAAVALLSIWPLLSLVAGDEAHRASWRVVGIEPRAGWIRVDAPVASWQPLLQNPLREQVQTFVKDGRRVSVYLGVFDRPTKDSKLTASANQFVASQHPHWNQVEHGSAQVDYRGEAVVVRTGMLVGQGTRITVWHWYWVDGTLTASAVRAALLQMAARLCRRTETSAWVAVFTVDGEITAPGRGSFEAFLTDMLDSIDQSLRAATNANGL